jgi:predicted GTPase
VSAASEAPAPMPAPAPAGTADDPAATVRDGLRALVRGLAEVADPAGLGHVVAPLLAECARPAGPTTRVAIVGAAKRGKSALVNAVLGRPDLLPVDADLATGVHVAVRHGERERALVHRIGVAPLEVGLDEIARYASERHNPGNAADVTALEVEVTAPLLAGGLELVDTPGVDGLAARHAEITLAALGLADALVLVLDAGRPLTAPELAFLKEATRRIGTVVFALTKSDTHREWRRVLDDDRALVSHHAPRFAGAPFVGVSGKLKTVADRARGLGRAEVADRVEAEANTAALAAELVAMAGAAELLRLGNAVQLAHIVIARLRSTLRASQPAADPDLAARLEADRESLRRTTDDGSRWRQELAHGFRTLQLDVESTVAASAARADEAMADSLATWDPARGETLGRELDDVARSLWLEAAAVVRERVEVLVGRTVDTVAAQGVALARPELTMPTLHRETTRRPTPDDDPTAHGLGAGLSSYGAAAGIAFGAERLLVPLGLVAGLGGLGLGAALALAGVALRRQGMTRVREQRAAQRMASRAISEAREHTRREFVKHLVEVQFGLETSVSDLLTERRRDLDAAVEQGRAALRASEREQREGRDLLAARLAALDRLRADAGALRGTVASNRRTGS